MTAKHAKEDRNAEMCRLFKEGMSGKELARRFRVTRARVYQIVKGLRRKL